MIEYLLVLARKQIRCPLPDCPFLFVSKLNSPPIICFYAVVLCIACEDHLQIRAVESGKRRWKWTGETWSTEEKSYDCPLKLFFPVCSFDVKFVSRCQCMHLPQPEQQVASGEWGREAEQRKLAQNLENWENRRGEEKDLLLAWCWRIYGSGYQTVAKGPLTIKMGTDQHCMWFCSSEVSMKFRQKHDLSHCLAGWPQCCRLCMLWMLCSHFTFILCFGVGLGFFVFSFSWGAGHYCTVYSSKLHLNGMSASTGLAWNFLFC